MLLTKLGSVTKWFSYIASFRHWFGAGSIGLTEWNCSCQGSLVRAIFQHYRTGIYHILWKYFILSESICNSFLSLYQVYINSWFCKYLKKKKNIEHIVPRYDKIQMHTSSFLTLLLLGKEEGTRMDIEHAPAHSEWSLHQDPRACHEVLLSFSEDIWAARCNTSDWWQLGHLE